MTFDKNIQKFKDKNVVIAGGTGMIGRLGLSRLCDAGAHIRSLSLDRLTVYPDAEHIIGYLTDFTV